MVSEFDLIARYFAPLARGADGALGLLDDAACLCVPGGEELIVTTDTVIAGVHFFADDPARLIACKALRVNLSDLAAKGAVPYGYFLNLALPRTPIPGGDGRSHYWDAAWLEAFSQGLAEDQRRYEIQLMGGDTTATPGPLTLSITALGRLPKGQMLRRDGARAGDYVYVSGSLGDAALGLRLRKWKAAGLENREQDLFRVLSVDRYQSMQSALEARYVCPEPRVALGIALRACRQVRAAMDVSDGLWGDLEHICRASGVGARIELKNLPLSEAVQNWPDRDEALGAALSGGDDYEILFTAPPYFSESLNEITEITGCQVTKIGEISEESDVVIVDLEGRRLSHSEKRGYRHF